MSEVKSKKGERIHRDRQDVVGESRLEGPRCSRGAGPA